MTPEQRIAAIRADLTERNMAYPLGARDAWWLLRCAEALRDVAQAAAAMPEPLVHRSEPLPPWCAYCRWDNRHAPDCPWLLLQSALQRWREVQG